MNMDYTLNAPDVLKDIQQMGINDQQLQPINNFVQQAPKRSFFNPFGLTQENQYRIGNFINGIASSPIDASQGWGGLLHQAVMGGVNANNKLRQDTQSYNAYKPYFDQIGVDTNALNPAMGGSGFGELNPTKLIDLQDNIENREFNRMYKQAYLDYLTKKIERPKPGLSLKRSDVMSMYPQLSNLWKSQYDFSNGQNQEFLNQELPVDAIKAYVNSLPKNYNVNKTIDNNLNVSGGTTKNIVKSGNSTSNIVYSGGVNSTKEVFGSKNPNPNRNAKPKTTLKEGQTGTYNGKKVIVRNGKWEYR